MSVVITPEDLQHYGSLELLARQVVEGFITGMHKSPFHGFSVEFSEHRIYNPGESTRHIDWKLLARSDKVFVKRYEDETNLRCHIILDVSSSMYYPQSGLNKLRFSVFATAALVHLLRRQRDSFGITLATDKVVGQTETKSTASHQQLIYSKLETLLNEENKTLRGDLSPVIHQLADTLPRRSLVVIFSDFLCEREQLQALFSAFQHLKFGKHEVIVFHVSDRNQEAAFDFPNRPHRFVDLESGEEIKIQPIEIKQEYINMFNEHGALLRQMCIRYGIDYNDVKTGSDFNPVLMPFFVRRSGLK